MFSIGALARRTGVKVATIRYYEQIGLIDPPVRTEGNQRRYDAAELERLGFIRHARDLGFSLDSIAALIKLSQNPTASCGAATGIARRHLQEVRAKIGRLRRLERELARIAEGAEGCDAGAAVDCYVLASLASHDLCEGEH